MPISSVQVGVSRRGDRHVLLGFRVVCDTELYLWPGDQNSGNGPWERIDDLWVHSCFEAFGMLAEETGYFELNFATGGKWAAYEFYDYRKGMRSADDILLTGANWTIRQHRVELNALVEVPAVFSKANWQLSLSAIIEDREGHKSYWALAHPPGNPDFHHPDCFTLELPPPSTP